MKTAVKIEKYKSFQLFLSILILILSDVFGVSAEACDKSRKILEGENFGEITHLTGKGPNSNYTQVFF